MMGVYKLADTLSFSPKVHAEGNTLVIGSMFPIPSMFMKQTPDDICDVLANTEQSLKISLNTGASVKEIMTSNKPMLEDVCSGFGVNIDINLISNFK
jgi:hypothetical protein